MRRITPGLGVLVALSALTGCANDQPAQSAPTAESVAATTLSVPQGDGAAATPGPTESTNVEGLPEYHDGHDLEPPANPAWDDVDRGAVVYAATQAVTAFARPDLPYEQWWAELSPLMSTQAQLDYQYVDPANVPARTVTGAAAIVDDASASVASVEVSTDVGPYTVVLSRADEGAPWLVERLSPPQSVG